MLPFFISDEMGFSDEELLLFAASGGKAVEDTATGNPLVFTTDLARPLKSLLIPFAPVQSGTGDPSPQNIRSILPWNGLTVFGGGKNLINPSAEIVTVQNTSQSNRSAIRLGIKNCKLTFSATAKTEGDLPTYNINVAKYKNGVADGVNTFISSVSGAATRTVEFASDEEAILIYALNNDETFASNIAKFNIQVEVGTTATAYEPYKPITETDIVFPSPVYGGEHEAVSGKLMDGWNKKTVAEIRLSKIADHIFSCYFSDRKYGAGTFGIISDTYKTITAAHSTGSTIETLYATYGDGIYVNAFSGTFYICDSRYTDAEEFKTAMADTVVVYELATPVEIQLTPEQITALKGDNTIWSDADGQMTAVYLKKG